MSVDLVSGDFAALAAMPAQLNYRPLRRAYSVREGDVATCRDVIRFASKCWGGIFDLIAVERADLSGAWNGDTWWLLHALSPDTIFVAGGNGDTQVARMERLRATTHIEIATVRRHLVPAHARRPFVLSGIGTTPVAAPGNALLWQAAAWGDEAPSLVEQDMDALLEIEGDEIRVDADGAWPMPIDRVMSQVMAENTLIDSTAHGVRLESGESQMPFRWIFVPLHSPEDVSSIALFWNMRALHKPYHVRVVPWPLWASRDELAPLEPLIRHGIGEERTTEPDVFVACYRETIAEARAALPKLYAFVERKEHTISAHYSWPAPRRRADEPADVGFGIVPLPEFVRLAVSTSREYPITVRGELRLRLAPPDAVARAEGSTALDLVDFPPLMMPREPALAQLVHPNARASGADFTWIGSFSPSEFPIKLPSDAEVLRTLTVRRGLPGEQSAWGELAQRTLGLVGGLQGASILQDDIALRILRALAEVALAESGRPVQDERTALGLEEISSRVWQGEPRRGKADIAPALDRLVSARLVFAGIRVQCPSCGMSEWRIVDEIRTAMTCQSCRAPFPFGLRSLRYGHLEPTWEYRLNGLLQRPINQGVLPAILTLRLLASRAAYRFRFTLGHLVADLGELDAIMTVDREPAVLEVKDGSELDASEVTRTVGAARRLEGYAIFATGAARWSETATSLLEAAQSVAVSGNPLVELLVRDHLLSRVALPVRVQRRGLVEAHQ